MKIMLAADGSEYTRVAARGLANHLNWLAQKPTIEVFHVRPPFPMRSVSKKQVDEYQKEEAEKALAIAEEELRKAGLEYKSSWKVGDIAEEINAYVQKNGVDLVVMGSHGHGALKGIAMGSVTTKVIAAVKVPVLIAR